MTRTALFSSAITKLTLSYLGILLLISMLFSTVIFGLASRELHRSFNRPMLLNELRLELPKPERDRPALESLLQEHVEDGRRVLAFNLLYLNLAVLVVGGFASYGLARWTLRPIERSHRAQSQFAADASHELRTPLTAMRAETEVLLNKPELTLPEAKHQLRSNLEELDKMTTLTQSLLRLARTDTDRLHARPVALRDVVRAAIDRVALAATHKGVAVQKATSGKDPSTEELVEVQGDRDALVELIAILLENAIKYTPVKGRVTVGMERQGKGATLWVRDEGPGISAEQLPNIFKRGYRGSSGGKAIPGYGLGLSIAQSIADLHGARLDASSRPGKGSTFTVAFPSLA